MKSQYNHEAAIRLRFELFECMPRIARDVRALGNVSPEPLVEILDARLLPGRSWMAKIYLHVELLFQSLVFEKEDVIVERDRLDFRKSFLHPQERPLDIAHRYGEDLLQEHFPDISIDESKSQSFAAFAGDDEVTLHMTESLSLVDSLGSFGDQTSAIEHSFLPSATSSSFT